MEVEPSFWEINSWFAGIDFCVIGAGIVGLNAAIRSKELKPEARVVVMERGMFPTGASTRNAGFACFGSMTELLDDLEQRSQAEVLQTVSNRWKGLQRLRGLMDDRKLGYEGLGSYEVFAEQDEEAYELCLERMAELNQVLGDIFDETVIFSKADDRIGDLGLVGVKHLIYNHLEGQLDTGLMMRNLQALAVKKGVEVWNGAEISGFEKADSGVKIMLNRGTITVDRLIVATNAFTNKLLQGIPVKPARNQVLITGPIPGLKLKGSFYYQKGYGYFRNVGQRVLIGGFRHLDPEAELTEQWGLSPTIQKGLESFLVRHILRDVSYDISQRWSGFLGVGDHKEPIIQKIEENMVLAVRLGGMGIAIGSDTGRKAAELLIS